MIDTGSATSVIKPNLVTEFKPEKLSKSLYFSTINGINEITHKLVTPMPKEFQFCGTVSWKIIDLKDKKYDAIMGQNFLVPFKAKINLEFMYIEINNNKIPFEDYIYPYILNEICSLDGTSDDFLEKIKLEHLNSEEKCLTANLLKRNKDLFFKEGDKLTSTQEIRHEIVTSTDRPVFSKIYKYPQVHEKEIERQIQEMLEQGIIQESNSPYNSPLWIVPKKTDNSGQKKWRIVIDYRKLNEITVDDKFPIPNIDNILNKLGRAQYFTTLDLAKGFHQILMKESDRKKTAFSTPFGHYEFIRMPFGLKNAPSTFQRLMNTVLREHINKICVVYLDDILIFSTSLEEHLSSIKKIFDKLRSAGLKIQIDKCDFLSKETEFLGHILTPQGLKPNPAKIEVIKNLRLPTSQKQIKSFLGITGYYRKFVKDYAKIANPMIKYLRKGAKININDPCYVAAFENMKELITSHPILRYPNFNKRFKLVTDASNSAIGAVLTQEGHPICYASRTLNDHERNYSTIEKELLAIVWGVKYFRPYTFGKEFDLLTDHQPIKWLQSKHSGKDINPRLQRWLIQLGEYNMKVDFIKGRDNKVADFLSRINSETNEINSLQTNCDLTTNNIKTLSVNHMDEHSDTQSDMENFSTIAHESMESDSETDSDLENLSTIAQGSMDLSSETQSNMENLSIIAHGSTDMQTIHSQEEESNDHIPLLETVVNRFKLQIIFVEKKDKEHESVFNNKRIFVDKQDLEQESDIFRRYVNKGRIGIFTELGDGEYNILQQKLVELFPNRNLVKFVKCSHFARDIEDEEQLRRQIALYHKKESGHSGIAACYEGLKMRIYHPNLKIIIYQILNNCEICTGAKYDRQPIKKKFEITETPKTVNEIVHIDIYTNNKHNFLNVIDKFSKHAVSLYLEDRTHITLLEKIKQVIAIRGKMKKLVFDNEFDSRHIRDFCNKENIEYHVTKPNSHTGNADVERLNNTITEKIRALNLEEKLPIRIQILKAVELYNQTFHSTIKTTPLSVQNKEVDSKIIYDRLKATKLRVINKRNRNREEYTEQRNIGFIKNYKSLRHKEEPKFRKYNLANVHETNIKRPFKFSDKNHEDNTAMDTNPANADPSGSNNDH